MAAKDKKQKISDSTVLGSLKRPEILIALAAVVFIILLFMLLSRSPSINNVNTCVSNCTFNNN